MKYKRITVNYPNYMTFEGFMTNKMWGRCLDYKRFYGAKELEIKPVRRTQKPFVVLELYEPYE